MQVDVSFQFAKVFDITKFEVVLGQKFTLFTDSSTAIDWFADKDSVLALTEGDTWTDVEATALGTSIILIMDSGLNAVKKLTIEVVAAIVEPAKSLNVSADPAVAKT
jgi:hypothetical protein